MILFFTHFKELRFMVLKNISEILFYFNRIFNNFTTRVTLNAAIMPCFQ